MISPIFLLNFHIGYFCSFLGVVIGLPILNPLEPAFIFPIIFDFAFALVCFLFSAAFFFAVRSFFEMYPCSPGKMSGVFIAIIIEVNLGF